MNQKPSPMKAYESFSAWKDDQSLDNKKSVNELQKLIEDIAPHFITTVKWGQGCWEDDDKPKVFIHAEDDHVQLGFYNGSTLNDPQGLLSGNGKYVRFVRIYGNEDINTIALTALISQVT